MKKSMTASVLALVASSTVFAQSEPGNFKTESGFVVTPLLEMGLKQDDNIYNQPSNETSSAIFTVDPSINFLLEDGVNRYSVDVGAFSGFYAEDSTDNYFDGFIALNSHLEQSSRSRFDLNARANWTTEPRGTGLSEGQGDSIDEPVRYADQTLEAKYEYGAKSAFGRVAARVKYYNKEYLNFTNVTQFRDIDQLLVGGKFIYNTKAGSDAFIELTHEDINYKNEQVNVSTRDSKDMRALVGFEWEATALTTGSAKVGYQKKEFDDTTRGSFDGLSWEASVAWAPLTYSSFDFTTSQAAVDPLTEGNYIEQRVFDLGWNHNWSELFSSRVSLNYMDEEYVGVTRNDETLGFVLSADYQLLRWLNVGVFAELSQKDSTTENLNYDKNTFGVNARLSM
ncbi:outer membrane beta-barrel protein [Pseudoalteromonas sp. G4]|uniref:outer membrane beta-barrel protein n=1 Tax=Pseudoalteromonas sp. G4 TaxID=2992761 RepID=UPI00237D4160|nr:outer membrane beta-barrel protein [Pseudoalteromonas sp. G4]MDE3270656.1 outer membrane beta-barrel protein [Pseudoalteromonas sp. G4]